MTGGHPVLVLSATLNELWCRGDEQLVQFRSGMIKTFVCSPVAKGIGLDWIVSVCASVFFLFPRQSDNDELVDGSFALGRVLLLPHSTAWVTKAAERYCGDNRFISPSELSWH